jgi:hypothetical protein
VNILDECVATADELHRTLAQGWNTWDTRSVLRHVLLPAGLGKWTAQVSDLEDPPPTYAQVRDLARPNQDPPSGGGIRSIWSMARAGLIKLIPETTNLGDQPGDVVASPCDEPGVLVPALIGAVDIAVGKLDKGGSDHVTGVEVRPPPTATGVGRGADGDQVGRVVVVEETDVPRPRCRCCGEFLDGGQFVLV